MHYFATHSPRKLAGFRTDRQFGKISRFWPRNCTHHAEGCIRCGPGAGQGAGGTFTTCPHWIIHAAPPLLFLLLMPVQFQNLHEGSVSCLEGTHSGRLLFSGGADGLLMAHDLRMKVRWPPAGRLQPVAACVAWNEGVCSATLAAALAPQGQSSCCAFQGSGCRARVVLQCCCHPNSCDSVTTTTTTTCFCPPLRAGGEPGAVAPQLGGQWAGPGGPLAGQRSIRCVW